jgi:hypothetical protein
VLLIVYSRTENTMQTAEAEAQLSAELSEVDAKTQASTEE